jgi:hypothetical protein
LFNVEVTATAGSVNVQTTSERGHTPEELSANAVAKIISISRTADPVLKQQAEAFRDRMFHVIVYTLEQAIKSDRTTLYNEFKKQGHGDMAEILRKL